MKIEPFIFATGIIVPWKKGGKKSKNWNGKQNGGFVREEGETGKKNGVLVPH